jgi:hypothetical protein
MNTYVTDAEMSYFWSQYSAAGYSTVEKTNALEASYGLVNGYIGSDVKVPAVAVWDEESETVSAPTILKYAQANFCRAILLQQELGNTSYVQELMEATIAMLRGVEDGDLVIADVMFSDTAPGWAVVVNTFTEGIVHIRNDNSYLFDYPVSYVIEIDSAGDDKYPYGADNTSDYATFKWKEYGASAWNTETVKAENRWIVVGDHSLNILFEGKFNNGESITIKGTPESYQNVSTSDNTLKSKQLSWR